MFRRKQTCADCHFFVKQARALPSANPVTVDVSKDERAKAARGDFSWAQEHWVLMCQFAVWDEGYNFDRKARKAVIVETNRRNFCFFWAYRPGMLFPAAKILQEREADRREARRDRRLTMWGLWIAALALLANTYKQIGPDLRGWWKYLTNFVWRFGP